MFEELGASPSGKVCFAAPQAAFAWLLSYMCCQRLRWEVDKTKKSADSGQPTSNMCSKQSLTYEVGEEDAENQHCEAAEKNCDSLLRATLPLLENDAPDV